jgi:hypothetical protein
MQWMHFEFGPWLQFFLDYYNEAGFYLAGSMQFRHFPDYP